MSPPMKRQDAGGLDGSGGRSTSVSPFRATREPALRKGPIADEMHRPGFSGPLFSSVSDPFRSWESLTAANPEPRALARLGLPAAVGTGVAAGAFDILRTRLSQGMEERGWTRLAITSPTHGCGKTFVAIHLAFGLARRPDSRTVLMDLELRRPGLARTLELDHAAPIRDFLTNEQPLESHFMRVGQSLALCPNGTPVQDAAELLNDARTAEALDAMQDSLRPDLVLYDMPPALVCDDVIAFRPQIDAVLLVADGTRTTADDIRRCERLFEDRIPLMGVVLNRAQDCGLSRYRYGRQ